MRPFIFLILFLAQVAFSFAQQTRTSGWFFETGVSSSHYCHLDFSDKGNVYGFHAGIISNIPLAKSFAIQAGIKIQSAGGRTEIDQPMFHWESSTSHTMYLQLPVDFIYKFPVAKTYCFYTGLGPYISKGITGEK